MKDLTEHEKMQIYSEMEQEILTGLKLHEELDTWYHNNLKQLRKEHADLWVFIGKVDDKIKIIDHEKGTYDPLLARHPIPERRDYILKHIDKPTYWILGAN